MTSAMRRIVQQAKALHKDERGADMVEYILIVAALALPILGFVVYFWKDIKEFSLDLWEDVTGQAKDQMPT